MNVPDDWSCYYLRCSCGASYHASEGGHCEEETVTVGCPDCLGDGCEACGMTGAVETFEEERY